LGDEGFGEVVIEVGGFHEGVVTAFDVYAIQRLMSL
jgi:hypothetical protein